MQSDWIYSIASKVNYPWVSRIDRSIYQKYPQLDPTQLGFRSLIASCIGYWLAKASRKNRFAFAGIFTLPVFAHYLFQEWKLSKDLKAFDQLDFNLGKKLPVKVVQDSNNKLKPTENIQSPNSKFKHVRSIPEIQGKLINARDFISQLPQTYFRPRS